MVQDYIIGLQGKNVLSPTLHKVANYKDIKQTTDSAFLELLARRGKMKEAQGEGGVKYLLSNSLKKSRVNRL